MLIFSDNLFDLYNQVLLLLDYHFAAYAYTVLLQPSIILSRDYNCSLVIDPIYASQDESSLIWLSSGGERSLRLASVSNIIPGQRTVSSSSCSLIIRTLFGCGGSH